MTDETSPVRRRRRELGLTVEQLSAKAGVSSATIWRFEQGKQLPLPETVAALASALGVDSANLVTGTSSTKRSPSRGKAPLGGNREGGSPAKKRPPRRQRGA